MQAVAARSLFAWLCRVAAWCFRQGLPGNRIARV